MLIPVVLSGGAGTRLWPLSRELYPKQLLPLTGTHTMLQDTLLRLAGLEVAAPVVVCNEAHRFSREHPRADRSPLTLGQPRHQGPSFRPLAKRYRSSPYNNGLPHVRRAVE